MFIFLLQTLLDVAAEKGLPAAIMEYNLRWNRLQAKAFRMSYRFILFPCSSKCIMPPGPL